MIAWVAHAPDLEVTNLIDQIVCNIPFDRNIVEPQTKPQNCVKNEAIAFFALGKKSTLTFRDKLS